MGYISNLIMTFLTFVMVSANLEAENLCLYKSQGNFWKISSLKPDTGVLSVTDSMRANNLVEFNICEKVKWGDDEAYAVLRDIQTGKCSVLTGMVSFPYSYRWQEQSKSDPTKWAGLELIILSYRGCKLWYWSSTELPIRNDSCMQWWWERIWVCQLRWAFL